MEKNKICKICNRRFSNGKAMGGHMRSHLAKLPLPPKPHHHHHQQQQQQQQQLHHHYPNSLSSSSSSLHFPPSPNPFQSYRSVNHDLPYISKPPPPTDDGGGGGGDGESETESSPRSMTRRRSKRRRKSAEKVAESLVVKVLESSAEQVSDLSDEIFNDEDVALCLLMLSKDHHHHHKKQRFKNNQNQKLKQKVICDVDEYFIGETTTGWNIDDEMAAAEEEEDDEEEEEDEDESFGEMPVRSIKSNGKYKCETCKKVFRSYQALGGHKASHKKIRKDDIDYDGIGIRSGSGGGASSSAAAVFVDQRIYKCPFCDKVFDSGQALGGHKKVHFSYLGNNVVNKPIPKSKSGDNLLDLNLPAPEEEDEEEGVDDELELSQVYEQRNW